MNQQGVGDYCVDIIMCIDATGSMAPIINEVKVDSTYQAKYGRLVAFVPKVAPWIELQTWNRYWPAFSAAGKGLSDVDIQSAIDLLVGSF